MILFRNLTFLLFFFFCVLNVNWMSVSQFLNKSFLFFPIFLKDSLITKYFTLNREPAKKVFLFNGSVPLREGGGRVKGRILIKKTVFFILFRRQFAREGGGGVRS